MKPNSCLELLGTLLPTHFTSCGGRTSRKLKSMRITFHCTLYLCRPRKRGEVQITSRQERPILLTPHHHHHPPTHPTDVPKL